MVPDLNVLRPIMKHWILRELNATLIVTIDHRSSPFITVPPCKESIFGLHQDCHGSIQTSLKIEVWLVHQQLAHRYSHTGAWWLPFVPYPLYKNIIFLYASICHGTPDSLSSLYTSGCHRKLLWCPNPCQIFMTSTSEAISLHNKRSKLQCTLLQPYWEKHWAISY